MSASAEFQSRSLLRCPSGQRMPAIGFGTLIPDPAITISATRDVSKTGYRHFGCAERYRNEREVGEVLKAGIEADWVARGDIFVTTKLWNTNHRPERVESAFEGRLEPLGLNHIDLYLMHTPFAFEPGDEQHPRVEALVDHGKCRAIGLSDIDLDGLQKVQIAEVPGKATAQVLLAWAAQRGTVLLTTPTTAAGPKRISTSPLFLRKHSTKSRGFRSGRGTTKS